MDISEAHRKELLRFLLLKTAAVRCGVKPGELLRVRHCYERRNSEGFHFCLYRKDIFQTLQLDYLELQVDDKSSLVLFFHPQTLGQVLREPENQLVLRHFGYPVEGGLQAMLDYLLQRFAMKKIPHEIGLFIGYPVKDVLGFIQKLPCTPRHYGMWIVFGDPSESLRRMSLYRKAEQAARNILDVCGDLQAFFDQLSNYNQPTTDRSIAHG
ncbi:MAG: DUF3793 family protein [Victivallales bacterium]|nr:DUF3793 family protein [Victivallales bacterium]